MNSQYSTIFSTGTTIISNTLLSNCQVDCLTFIWYQHNHLMNTFGSAHCYHCYRGGKISWPPQHHPPHSSLSVCYPPSTYHHISGLRSYHSQIPKLSILQPRIHTAILCPISLSPMTLHSQLGKLRVGIV